MSEPTLLKFEDVVSGDTYEIAYAHSYPEKHWSKESLYLSDDENGIGQIAPYLNTVFPNFTYFGPQKITLKQWDNVIATYKKDKTKNASLENFFEKIGEWIEKGNENADYFWILGI